MFNIFRRQENNATHSEQNRQRLIDRGVTEGKVVIFKKPEPKRISMKKDFDQCLEWYRWALKNSPQALKNDDGNFLEDVLLKYEEFNLLEKMEIGKLLCELPHSYDFLEASFVRKKIKI